MPLPVLSVASEAYPLIKTGGLADVVGALPAALKPHGVDVVTVLPGYPSVLAAIEGGEVVHTFETLFGASASIVASSRPGIDVLAIDAPHLFARSGGPYSGPDGTDWPDNALRFAALGKAAAEIAHGATGETFKIVHLHDWQAGLVAAYLAHDARPRPGIVATIHNMAFQGWFPPSLFADLDLPRQALSVEGVEYFGGIGYLKAAIWYADRITTVSPTYACEILEPDGGLGLDGLLSGRADVVSGVLNGIDDAVWDPQTDPRIPARFSPGRLDGRDGNRRALAERFGLDPNGRRLTFGVVSRLSGQKGLDLLAAAMPTLLDLGADLVMLGSGEGWLEDRFRAIAYENPGRVGVRIGYDEDLAHLIQAGADAILVPSRFEPCGLTQLCALRYGAVPVVARVGGLADTVIDANPAALAAGVATGVQFAPVCRSALENALRRAAALWADDAAWRALQANGMACDVSWDASARAYAALYRDLAGAS